MTAAPKRRPSLLPLGTLLCGGLLGVAFPYWRYLTISSNPERSRADKQLLLDHLPRDIVVGAIVGVAVGLFAVWMAGEVRRLLEPFR
jgi:hypothetical protein